MIEWLLIAIISQQSSLIMTFNGICYWHGSFDDGLCLQRPLQSHLGVLLITVRTWSSSANPPLDDDCATLVDSWLWHYLIRFSIFSKRLTLMQLLQLLIYCWCSFHSLGVIFWERCPSVVCRSSVGLTVVQTAEFWAEPKNCPGRVSNVSLGLDLCLQLLQWLCVQYDNPYHCSC